MDEKDEAAERAFEEWWVEYAKKQTFGDSALAKRHMRVAFFAGSAWHARMKTVEGQDG